MLDNWLFVGIFVLIGAVFPIAPILMGKFLGPNKPNPIKADTYECGMETVGESWIQFKVQYYIFALAFLIFDVEVVFLFPWAVAFDQLGIFAVVSGITFIIILVDALVYAWRKGALEWA
jgi:NADH-quinone oxidoreductase subunit A